MSRTTKEQEDAVTEWIKQVRPPEVAHASIRAKFKRLNLTPDEIRADMEAKVRRLTK